MNLSANLLLQRRFAAAFCSSRQPDGASGLRAPQQIQIPSFAELGLQKKQKRAKKGKKPQILNPKPQTLNRKP